MSTVHDQALHDVFLGRSQLGARMRDFDWARTPLGAPEYWPQSLRTLVGLMLCSRMPQYLAWGPELRLFYNDGYAEILGNKHPAALARPMHQVWPELWDELRPLVDKAMAGTPISLDNQPFVVRRSVHEETCWFSLAFTPVHDDESRVAGVHCAVTETTRQVLAQRSLADEMERLHRVLEQAPGFMAVVAGPNHVMRLANLAYQELVGHADLVGRRLADAVPEIDSQGYIELLDRVRATGKAFIGRRMPVKLRRGRRRAVEERYIDFILQPIVENDGSVTGVFMQGTDVTDHELAERELRESEARARAAFNVAQTERLRLNAVLDAVPVGIAYAETDGRLVTANAANRKIWGDHPLTQTVEGYRGWKGWWADHSERQGKALKPSDWAMARALRGEEVQRDLVEIEPFGLPDVRRRLLINAVPVRDVHGEIIGAVSAQTDVTEQMRAEAELRVSEARFRTITDAMPQMVWSTLADGYHDYFNQQWYDYTGLPPGAGDGEVWRNVVHPADLERVAEAWNYSLATGEPYETELRLRHRSGEYRWALARAQPVRDDHGHVVRWMGSCTDIHENKLALAALEDSEERFRTLADNIPQLAWMGDSRGALFWYNDRWFEYTGTTLEQMRGWGWASVQHPDYRERAVAKWKRHVEAGETWEDTFPLRGRDGLYRWFLSRAVPVRDAEGRITYWFGTNTDITSQRDAQDALRRADRRKDEFLAMLAHELRNPLAPISAAAQLLANATGDEARVRQVSEIVLRQVNHMSELVDDLLDVSRVTRGLVELHIEPLDLKAVAAAAVEQVRPLIETRRHTLTTRLEAGAVTVQGDRTRLVQVIANLLNNAAKYTPAGGEIELSLHARDEEVALSVSDNGAGIDRHLLPHVFELFTQAERTPDRSQGGLGIGLALVRSIVALHGGRIDAYSDGPGLGSSFVLHLPRIAAVVQPPAARAEPITLAAKRALQIMVVDDNDDAARTLGMLLEAMGHRVVVGEDGASALALLEQARPEVFVLDIGLPDMTGFELARRIRANRGDEDATFIALTGYGQPQDRIASEAAGFHHHLVKPVDPHRLGELLDRAAARA